MTANTTRDAGFKLIRSVLSPVLVALVLCAVPALAAPFAYVTNWQSNTVSVIDQASNTTIKTITVGSAPFAVAITPNGAFAYVTNWASNTVSVIATASGTVAATIPVGPYPTGVAITPNGAFAYVANWGSNYVSVIATATNTVLATVTVASNPYGVAITPDGAYAYVVGNLSDAVSVIETASNTLVTTIPVGLYPTSVAITPDGALTYVTNCGCSHGPLYNSTTVSVISTATKTVVATISVGSNPFGVAITPAGDYAYITDYSSSAVSVIAVATNTVVATVSVGGNPWGVAISDDGALAYVGNAANYVSVIATKTNTVVAVISAGYHPLTLAFAPTPLTQVAVPNVGGQTQAAATTAIQNAGLVVGTVARASSSTVPAGSVLGENPVAGTQVFPGSSVNLVISTGPAGRAPFAYVANYDSNTVSVIETATNIAVASIPVGSRPVGVAISPDGAFVYVANQNSSTVSVIATATNTVVATVPVGAGPTWVAITPDGAFAYVTNSTSSTVSVIATATNTVVATIGVGRSPTGIAISPDGAFTYVVSELYNRVDVIATATNTDAIAIAVGPFPWGVGITPDGAYAYVLHNGSNTASVIATASNTVVATVPAGSNPLMTAITPDGSAAYVTNGGWVNGNLTYQGTTVSVIATASKTVAGSVTVGANPCGVAITPDGSLAYVTNYGSGSVSMIATATNSVLGTIPVGAGPCGVAFMPTGSTHVYVPNVVGQTQAAASTAIQNARLMVGKVTTAKSSTVPAGNVISENPPAGTYVAVGSAVDLVVSTGPPLQAIVTLSNLTVTYNGSPQSPTVTTVPAGLSIALTGAPQTSAGHYPVTATITDPDYVGSANGTFIINKAAATVTLGSLSQLYTGSPLSPTVITSPPGLNVTLVGAPQTAVGSYPVTVSVNDANYTGAASGTFTINPSFGGALKTATGYQFSVTQYSRTTNSLQLTNAGTTTRSATLAIANPYQGLSVSLSSQNPVVVAPGQTQNISLVIDSGTLPVGTYDGILWQITGDDGSTLYSNIKINVIQQNLPDLAISSSDILPPVVNPDSSVTLAANIHNLGPLAASSVTVRFYDFAAVLGDTAIDQVIAGGTKTASVTVPLAAGNHLIRVVIDPSGAIPEIDKTNNEASQVIQIGSSPPPLQGGILVTGSLPGNVYTSSLFTVTGRAVYDLVVNGIEYTNYVVKGGSVQVTIGSSGGTQWVYGDVYTDINGNFAKTLLAPASAGTYQIIMTVTDKTFVGTRQLAFLVVVPPPPGTPPPATIGPAAWGTGHYECPAACTWVWDQLLVPPASIPQSDLSVYSQDIYFSKDNPGSNEEITIVAQVHYWASSSTLVARNVPVSFYVTYPGSPPVKVGQTVINSLAVTGPDFGSRYVYANWRNQSTGIYIVEVQIDPSYIEQNVLNNAATRAIIVGQALPGQQGAVSGHVTSPFGGVANVPVSVGDLGSTMTDQTGFYLMQNVPVGQIPVSIVTPAGYAADYQSRNTAVSNQAVSVVDFHLTPVTPRVVSFSVLFGSETYNVTTSARHRLPWQITGIRVTFSEPITSGGAASLSGATVTGFSGLRTNTLTWTIGPIALGNLTIALAGSGVNALADAAGSGLGGGAGFTQALKVLWGDYNDDGVVNASDLACINTARSGPYDIFADMNGDGVVDLTDVRLAGGRVGTTNP